jgi:NAD(P)-dependent dehydrogenase (short-subunit alcohol dehydrogenase family)
MKEFRDKVAVITGAASGIGRAIAERCVREGMAVVLADIEQPALDNACHKLASRGAKVVAIRTDVSRAEDIEALAQKTLEQFGVVHLLVNNAGVGSGAVAMGTLADWQWTLGVNLWGVIHGVHVFTPLMLKQDTEGHIVNTASIAGLVSAEAGGIYNVSKHAVVALSETLYHELAQMSAKVKVSVLCPGFVSTRFYECERNRPPELQNEVRPEDLTPEAQAKKQAVEKAIKAGIPPKEVADCVFQAIEHDDFYILTHPEIKTLVRVRMEDIIQNRQPTTPTLIE